MRRSRRRSWCQAFRTTPNRGKGLGGLEGREEVLVLLLQVGATREESRTPADQGRRRGTARAKDAGVRGETGGCGPKQTCKSWATAGNRASRRRRRRPRGTYRDGQWVRVSGGRGRVAGAGVRGQGCRQGQAGRRVGGWRRANACRSQRRSNWRRLGETGGTGGRGLTGGWKVVEGMDELGLQRGRAPPARSASHTRDGRKTTRPRLGKLPTPSLVIDRRESRAREDGRS